jgi:hypothetical protein
MDSPLERDGFEPSVPRVMDGDLGRQGPALIAVLELADEILNYLSSEFAMTLRAAVNKFREPPAPRPSGARKMSVSGPEALPSRCRISTSRGEYLVAGYARAHAARHGLST